MLVKMNRGLFVTNLAICLFLVGCSIQTDTLLKTANKALDKNDLKTARRDYMKILNWQPESPDAIQGMVTVSRLQNATDEQMYWCRELLKYRPWDRYANVVIGKQLVKEGNLKDAVIRFMLAYQNSEFKQDRRESLNLLKSVSDQVIRKHNNANKEPQ